MSKDLIIMGGGGFGAEAVWVAEDMNRANPQAPPWNILGYIDDDPSKVGAEYFGYTVLGTPEQFAESVGGREIWYHCALGENSVRENVVARLDRFDWHAATLIHPSVIRAKNAVVGYGTYVGPSSILSPNSRIGNHVIVNVHVSIGHDSQVGDFAMICPGARINGFCTVGRAAMVGSNASMVQGQKIADNVRVGSNSLVVHNVAADKTVIGVPALPFPAAKK
jgi:sugar O-acyltransferase (sialic acid O-acetyltransferase NeuD family)